jgi:rSAM/selenodomain-associated transferase 2
MKISVIIPVLNESGKTFEGLLGTLCKERDLEIVVVDGEARARSTNQLPNDLKNSPNLRLEKSATGRGVQLAKGASLATSDVLVFIHADTRPPKDFMQKIKTAVEQKGCQAGAFRFKLDAPGLGYRLIEWGVWLRCHFFKLPYGDQIIFVQKRVLEKMGGIRPLPMMEDLDLICRLKKEGIKIHLLQDPAITSARRWESHGVLKTTVRNVLYLVLFQLGIKPEEILGLEKHFS